MHSISRHLPIFLRFSNFFYTSALLHNLEVQKYALPAWQWTLSRYVPFTLQLLEYRFDKFLRTHSINHQSIEPIQTNEATWFFMFFYRSIMHPSNRCKCCTFVGHLTRNLWTKINDITCTSRNYFRTSRICDKLYLFSLVTRMSMSIWRNKRTVRW